MSDGSMDGTERLVGPDEDVETGQRYAKSELTGQSYRVTAWVEKDDDKIVALEKEEIEKPPHADEEKVHCPACGTTTWKDTIEDAVEAAEKHDQSMHDGGPTTKVNGIVPPQFSEEEKEEIQAAVQSLEPGPDRSRGDDT